MENPQSIREEARKVLGELLPPKSKSKYEAEYEKFVNWKVEKNVKIVNDDVVLVYLSELSKHFKSSTLWSKLSMIRSCLNIKENVDCYQFKKCIAFLKRQNVGYEPKKSNILTSDEIAKFMLEAPDQQWLMSKVVLLFGVFGACRRDDLLRLQVNDVHDNGNYLVVFLKDGKTHTSRSFIITNEDCSFNPCDIYRKYKALRPSHMKSGRLFICYRNGKCTAQNVGCHTIGAIPRNVAKFLNLKNPESYTGHAMRRSSATMLVEGGGDLLALKSHGGWRSSSVAEQYVEKSLKRKMDVSRRLFGQSSSTVINSEPDNEQGNGSLIMEENKFFTVDNLFDDELKTQAIENRTNINENISVVHSLPNRGINVTGNTNCTININFGLK